MVDLRALMSIVSASRIVMAFLCLGSVWAAGPSDLPPLPSELPFSIPNTSPVTNTIIRRPRIVTPPRPTAFPAFQNGLTQRVAGATYQPPKAVGDNVLAWDSVSKEYKAQPGQETAPFSFSVTNISKTNVTV